MKRLSILTAVLLAACSNGGPTTPTAGMVPVVAPVQAVTPRDVPGSVLVNPDFEQTAGDGSIPGWVMSQHAGPVSYAMRIDPVDAYAGHGSFHMTRTQPQIFGSLIQSLDARPYAGKTVELSAMLKSRGVGAGGWKLFINANVPGTLNYSRGLTGDRPWQNESVRLNVPAGARQLTVGVTLLDAGDGWMDDVELKTVD